MIGKLASFIEKTKYLSARSQYRACMSKFQFALMQSSSALGLIITQALRLVPFIKNEWKPFWGEIDHVIVNFPTRESVHGTMHGAQTFGPWEKKLAPQFFKLNQVFPAFPVDKNDIEMQIVVNMYPDNDLYIDGEFAGPGNIYKEIEWDENKTITLDIKKNFLIDPERLTVHGGGGTIRVYTRLKPGTCTYVNRTDVRRFQYRMTEQTSLDYGSSKFDCKTIGAMRCHTLPHDTRLGGNLGIEVTYPPPEGRKTPPCPKYRPIPPFSPADYEPSKGAAGAWRKLDVGLCNPEIYFEYRPAIDIVGGGLTNATCGALFTYNQIFDVLKYLEPTAEFPTNAGTWSSYQFPPKFTEDYPKLNALVDKYLREYLLIKVDIEGRSWDRVQRVRQRCTCDKLEATRCLSPQEKLVIIAALSAGSCAIAKTMLAGITARIARNPVGAACLAAGLFIFLSGDSDNEDEGKPPRR